MFFLMFFLGFSEGFPSIFHGVFHDFPGCIENKLTSIPNQKSTRRTPKKTLTPQKPQCINHIKLFEQLVINMILPPQKGAAHHAP